MKKVLSIVLAIAMIATMSVVAFANSVVAENAAVAGSKDIVVEATFANVDGIDMYKVDVEWTLDTAFKYTEAGTVWNTAEHKWDPIAGEEAAAKWEGQGTITVKNHSSEPISATPKWTAGDDGVVMGFNKTFVNVATAENTAKDAAPAETIVATIESGAIEADATLGTITVTIAGEKQ